MILSCLQKKKKKKKGDKKQKQLFKIPNSKQTSGDNPNAPSKTKTRRC